MSAAPMVVTDADGSLYCVYPGGNVVKLTKRRPEEKPTSAEQGE